MESLLRDLEELSRCYAMLAVIVKRKSSAGYEADKAEADGYWTRIEKANARLAEAAKSARLADQ